MSTNKKNEAFIETTLQKLQTELKKFIINTNYSNPYSLSVYQKLNTFKDKIKTEKQLNHLNTNNISDSCSITSYLPHIKQTAHPLHIHKPNSVYVIKNRNAQQKHHNKLVAGISTTKTVKEELAKNSKLKGAMNQTASTKAYSVEKYLKYSNENRSKLLFHDKIYDQSNYPIIRNKEMKQGLLDMIYKGYIPKIADLSPAFNQNGNPLTISNDALTKQQYSKHHFRDDVPVGNNKINVMKYVINEDSESTMSNNVNGVGKDNKKNECENMKIKEDIMSTSKTNNFITKKANLIFITNNNIINGDNTVKTTDELNSNFIKSSETANQNNCAIQSSLFDVTKEDDEGTSINNTPQHKKAIDPNKLLTFTNAIIIKNNIYTSFIKTNSTIKKSILHVIDNLSVLLKKLNFFIQIQVDTNKIIQLLTTKPKLTLINNKDLLLCLSEHSLDMLGLNPNNPKSFVERLRDIFAIKIQKKFRQYLSRIKAMELRFELMQIIKIQSWFRHVITYHQVQQMLSEYRETKLQNYNTMLNTFKEDWNVLTEMTRIEIHINSYSFSNYKNTTIDKYTEKENLQLNRLIRLIDPNLEIIYISPTEIDEDIFRYYFSILNTIGITNVEKRFHFIVPETASTFPPHYSLSQLLFFSTKTQNKIKRIICDKNAYIVPGFVSPLEQEISYLLECPILMGNIEQTELIFNKSGSKSAFEINDIPFPISAWDIKGEEEFYSSLAHLISIYPTINIWIFKINNETCGRGIAYLEISKIEQIKQFLHEKNSNPNFTVNLLKEKLFYFLSSSIKKYVTIVYPNIYPTWKEYLTSYIHNKGIIESCPTFDLSGILGSPVLPILIEPNGKVKVLPTYDKTNIQYFKNILCTSPQKTLTDVDMNTLGEKIGAFLYGQNIIGYVTIEFIAFIVDKNIKYWGIDMKFGLTDHITSLQYSYFLYIQSTIQSGLYLNNGNGNGNSSGNNNNNQDDISEKEIEIDYGKIINDALAFSIPVIVSNSISELMLKDFLGYYRYQNLVFDMEKREGVIFNLPDTLQSGILGICGIINLDQTDRHKGESNLWNIMERSLNCLLTLINKHCKKSKRIEEHFNSDKRRNDNLNLHQIYSKVKVTAKQKGKVFEDEKKILNNISNIFS